MDELASLARDGRLRAAINTGNRALVRVGDGTLGGVSPALARRLADRIGARFDPVVYEGAGKVFADAGRDVWDVAFLAIDGTRAEVVGFTRPYVSIEATYAARPGDRFETIADADRAGVTILVARGAAYDLHLSESLRHARLERAGSPGESFEAFRRGQGDLVAGIRESLEQAFGGDDAVRILPGGFHRVDQAMVLPDRSDPRLAALDAFVAEAIADGFVAGQH